MLHDLSTRPPVKKSFGKFKIVIISIDIYYDIFKQRATVYKNCCYVNFEFILNFMCQVFGVGEETCNCVLCHFWTTVDLLGFWDDLWGGSCHYQGENTLVDIEGWKLVRLCNQTSVIVKRMFDVSDERRGSARLVLGNSVSFSLVQLSYILVTSYSLWITIFEVTASETHSRLLGSLVSPKRHQLNVQTVFFRVNSWILQANCFPEAEKADCKC